MIIGVNTLASESEEHRLRVEQGSECQVEEIIILIVKVNHPVQPHYSWVVVVENI